MIRTFVMLCCVVTALSGCSRDPYGKYLGLWESTQGGGGRAVLEIKRDGETLLINENVLIEKDMLGRPKTPSVLAQNNGHLAVATGLGNAPLGLSEDEDFLLVMDDRYKRIEPKRLDDIRGEIAAEKKAAEENRERCKALEAQWHTERDALPQKKWSEMAPVIAQREEIRGRYKEQAKAIPHCSIW